MQSPAGTGWSESTLLRHFELGDKEFRFLVTFLSRTTGIALNEHKRHMVCGRLSKRLRALKLANFTEYCRLLKSPDGVGEVEHLINAITTNITHFFREPHHFRHLRTVLGERAAEQPRRPRIRLWSAGCSSGEEAYSMAMVMSDALRGPDWDALVLATDIDTNMLRRGREGLYPGTAAEAIPEHCRKRLVRRAGNASDKVRVADEIRSLIHFKRLNLHDPWPMTGPFDAIFCRNVVIYFDKETQRDLFNRFADLLAPGGYLYLGHAESLIGVSNRFEVADKTVYRRIR